MAAASPAELPPTIKTSVCLGILTIANNTGGVQKLGPAAVFEAV
jgi:hypothetical protein